MSARSNSKVQCPASQLGGVNGQDRIHFATPEELATNGGVCKKCRAAFAKRAASQTARTHESEHYELGAGVAFVDDHAEPTVDFVIEEGEMVATGLDSTAVQAIAKFCVRLFEIGGRNKDKFFQAAHAFAFAAHIHPEQEKTGEEIAAKFHICKQAFFKQVNRYRDILKLPRIAGAKKQAARGKYSKRMKLSHEQRKKHRPRPLESTGAFARSFGDALARPRKAD